MAGVEEREEGEEFAFDMVSKNGRCVTADDSLSIVRQNKHAFVGLAATKSPFSFLVLSRSRGDPFTG